MVSFYGAARSRLRSMRNFESNVEMELDEFIRRGDACQRTLEIPRDMWREFKRIAADEQKYQPSHPDFKVAAARIKELATWEQVHCALHLAEAVASDPLVLNRRVDILADGGLEYYTPNQVDAMNALGRLDPELRSRKTGYTGDLDALLERRAGYDGKQYFDITDAHVLDAEKTSTLRIVHHSYSQAEREYKGDAPPIHVFPKGNEISWDMRMLNPGNLERFLDALDVNFEPLPGVLERTPDFFARFKFVISEVAQPKMAALGYDTGLSSWDGMGTMSSARKNPEAYIAESAVTWVMEQSDTLVAGNWGPLEMGAFARADQGQVIRDADLWKQFRLGLAPANGKPKRKHQIAVRSHFGLNYEAAEGHPHGLWKPNARTRTYRNFTPAIREWSCRVAAFNEGRPKSEQVRIVLNAVGE